MSQFKLLVGVILSLGLIFISSDTYATNSSLSVTLDTDTISVNLPPTDEGKFAKSNDATISVTTDYNYGYTLSITAANSTNLVSGSNTLPTLGNITSESDFSTSGDYNNKWGYSPSQYVSNGDVITNTNRDFLPSPSTTGSTLDITDSANPTVAKTYALAIGARANTELPIGAYSNTFVIAAVANSVPYEINYYANTTDTVTDLPSSQIGGTYDTVIQLSDLKPSRGEYGFYGWCTVATTNAHDCESRGGTTYRAGSDYTISQSGTNTLDLYAIWGTYSELDTGANVSTKMKTLANNGTATSSDTKTEDIKAILMADALPTGFTPSEANTISLSTSTHPPTYIWYDNTNDAGILYVYTAAEKVRMNEDSAGIFQRNLALADISGIADWDTQTATTLQQVFCDCPALTDLDALANWDTSNNTNLTAAFYVNSSTIKAGYMSHLSDISGLLNWDTSNVTTLYYTFGNQPYLHNLHGLENWDTSNVENLSLAFGGSGYMSSYAGEPAGPTDLTPLANWDVSNVTNLYWTFGFSLALTDISALANWDVSNVTNLSRTFTGTSISSLHGIEKWNTSSVTNMAGTFWATPNLVDFSPIATTQRDGYKSWDVSGVTDMSYFIMDGFQDNNNSYDTTPFYKHSTVDLTPFSTWDTSSVTNMYRAFLNIDALSYEPLTSWDVSKVTNFETAFYREPTLDTYHTAVVANLDGLDSWNTAAATNMKNMFSGQTTITDASAINGWNINSVTNFTNMFNSVPAHPNFTNRAGSWDANGTFTPSV